MKITLKIISLLLILLCLSITAVSAADYDNQTIDLNDNEIGAINSITEDDEIQSSTNTKTFTDLQSAFWAAPEGYHHTPHWRRIPCRSFLCMPSKLRADAQCCLWLQT